MIIIFNRRTQRVLTASDKDDTVVPEGCGKAEIEGAIGDLAINPVRCLFDGQSLREDTVGDQERLAAAVRAERNMRLVRDIDSINAVRWAGLSGDQQAALAQYRQDLLDVPGQAGFPENVVWPVAP